ncbi:Inner membrane protein YbjJ [Aquisphaera giovannonii]|uniref:Inner membrane protein YbjJ n=1 Tax=Aquisphaera giovannonii TaxID=406548 RepID=A0A5B9VWB2_9BACT|nr:MFS transporter [Aquisphaera giovannonii]QEH32528.1 Inner membrane protein YbjJ [Aquisphaera giovannonii]
MLRTLGGEPDDGPAALRRARGAVLAMFAVDGLGFGPWAAHLPEFKASLGLSDGGLSVPLFATVMGSLAAMPVAGRLIPRAGSRRVLLAAAFLYSAIVPLIALAVAVGGGLPLFTAVAFFYGAIKGTIDVAANAQAVGVERASSSPILSSCHGCWSLGSLAGAGGAALALRLGSPPLLTMGLAGLVLAALTVASAPHLRADDRAEASGGAGMTEAPRGSVWPTGRLLPLGVLAFLGLFCEGSVADWSAVYLAGPVGVSAASAALGFTAYMTAMTLTRFLGDRLVGRLGPAAVLRGGGLLVAAGLGGALAARSLPAAMVGFGLVGVGLANAVPVIFRSAGSGHDPGGAIASVSTIGYLGFLAGPPAIGVLAEAVGLPVALLLVVAFGLAIAVAAGAALGRGERRGGVPAPALSS